MAYKEIFKTVTGKFLIARILVEDNTEDLGGGMKLTTQSTPSRVRILEVLEVPKNIFQQYNVGDYIAALPSRATENFDFLGEMVTYVHPDDILGILNNERQLQIQESIGAGNQQRTS